MSSLTIYACDASRRYFASYESHTLPTEADPSPVGGEYFTTEPKPGTERYEYAELTPSGAWVVKVDSGRLSAKVANLRALRLKEAEDALGTAVAAITDKYPKIERESWPSQIEEASAYIDDNSAATPFIDGLIAGTDVTKAQMAAKILQKSADYRAVVGAATGAYQKHRDVILATDQLDDMDAYQFLTAYAVQST